MDECREESKLAKLELVEWDAWRNMIQETAKISASTTRLLRLTDLLPNGAVEYLSCQPYLQCSNACKPIGEKGSEYLSTASLKLFLNRLKMQKMSSIQPTRVGNRDPEISNGPSKNGRANARPLEGKVAIVTGASSGIGRGIAIELARSGCNIAIAAHRGKQLKLRKI